MYKYIIYVTLSLLVFTSCKSNKQNNLVATVEPVLNQSSFTEILSGSHSNINENKQLVIKTQKDLVSHFSIINQTKFPKNKIPTINFDKIFVIALYSGEKTSGSFSVFIDHIKTNKKEVVVYYSETAPTGMVTNVMTQPFYLASITKTELPIRFEKM